VILTPCRPRTLLASAVALLAAALAASTPVVSGAPSVARNRPALTSDVVENDLSASIPADAAIYGPNSNAVQYAAVLAAQKVPKAAGSVAWKAAGPDGVGFVTGVANGAERIGPVGGMGSALAVDTTDPSGNTAYLGMHGGVYVTRDGGRTETNISDGKIPRAPVGALALDPAHPGDLYVGTGIALLTISGDASGTGMWVSHDGGRTFTRPARNVGGYGVNVITVTPQAVFVGTNTGLYRSTDRGASFTAVPLPTNAAHTAPGPQPYGSWVTAINAKPGAPQEVTVAVGFGFGHRPGPDGKPLSEGNGLYRSTSAGAPGSFAFLAAGTAGLGQTARTLGSTDTIGRISLAYGTAPDQQDTMWALVSDAGYATGGQNILGLPDLPDPLGLGVHPLKPGALNGLYRSTDDGASWTLQATSETLLAAPNSTLNALAAIGEYPGVQAFYNNWVLTDPIDPNRVYIGLEEAFEGEYGAANPTNVATPGNVPLLTRFQVMERYADPCGFYTTVTSSLTGGSSTACPDTGLGLYGGQSTHPDQHAAQIVTLKGGGERIYNGNDGGFFVEDAGRQPDGLLATGNLLSFSNNGWVPVNSASTLQPYHAAFWSRGRILVGLQDNGTAWVTPDGKGTEVCGGDGVDVFPGPTDDSLFCTHFNDSVEYVTGDGQNSALIGPSTINPWGLTPMAQDPADHTHLIIGGRDVQELTTLGDPNPRNQLLGTGQGTFAWTTVYDAGSSPAPGVDWQASAFSLSGSLAYVGTCGACRATYGDTSTIHSTVLTDVRSGCTPKYGSDACWHKAAGAGLPKRRIAGVAFDPANPRTVYVGLQDVSFVGYDPKIVGTQRVMVSRDAGEHFSDVSGNLPLTNVNQVLLRNGQLIAATDLGVFTTKAGTKAWTRLGTGLPATTVKDIRLDESGKRMVAAVFGRGAWVYTFPTKARTGTGVVPPKKHPQKPPHVTKPAGSLAATGVPVVLGLLALALVLAGLGMRRRSLEE
jgi:hypothetical protein